MTVRVSSVCGTLVREKIIDRNIFQHCSTEKRSQSVQRLQSWWIYCCWKSPSLETYSQGCPDPTDSVSCIPASGKQFWDPVSKLHCRFHIQILTHRVLRWAHAGFQSISWRHLYLNFITMKTNHLFSAGYVRSNLVRAPTNGHQWTCLIVGRLESPRSPDKVWNNYQIVSAMNFTSVL